jgi:hypothetical protein
MSLFLFFKCFLFLVYELRYDVERTRDKKKKHLTKRHLIYKYIVYRLIDTNGQMVDFPNPNTPYILKWRKFLMLVLPYYLVVTSIQVWVNNLYW